MTGYGMDDPSLIPVRGRTFFLWPLHPDRLWGIPSFLSNEYRGPFPEVKHNRTGA